MPISVAIVGAGPAGFYTAEALLESCEDVRIDFIERLPTPFGLIRSGVAPDHQSTKQVSKRFERSVLQDVVHFYGNVEVGRHVGLSWLREVYDAVVLAVGSGSDRGLGVPGEQLRGVYGSAVFVGWYNGHPDFHNLSPYLRSPAIVIGNGNVALDVARVLLKSPAEMASSDLPDYAMQAIADADIREVCIVGRRGPEYAKFSALELREMGGIEDCAVCVEPADLPERCTIADARERRLAEKNLGILRSFTPAGGGCSAKRKTLRFRFGLRPIAVCGYDHVQSVRFASARSNAKEGDEPVPVEEFACGVLISAVGYRGVPLEGAPFDADRGLFANDDGRIGSGLYVVGWAKRGASGVIGTNKPDGALCAEQILADATGGAPHLARSGRAALEAMLRAGGVAWISFADWQKLDEAEMAAARHPAPRRKFTTFAEMLQVLAASAAGRPLEGAAHTSHLTREDDSEAMQ